MYDAVFICSILATIVSHIITRPTSQSPTPPPTTPHIEPKQATTSAPFRTFQINYLVVYFLAVAADWLQGPYVYALYAHYGYENNAIAHLYIAGFASSAIFGTFVASIADKYGRRNSALIYCLAYILSCLTKHSPNFHVLCLGRILGGIAYSILFSAFDAWMVYEHHARAFAPSLLATTFARAQFGNAIVAVLSGQTAGWFTRRYGKVIPFDISIVLLLILAVALLTTWPENYGDSTQTVRGGFERALRTLLSDRKILLLGIAQAAFEGALYTFTFVWTPALQTAVGQTTEIPHGTIFSTFMACTIIGSNIFTMLARYTSIEAVMRNAFLLGAALFIVAIFAQTSYVTYFVFLAFEIVCGIYFPGMATMRAPYIPEESRSALLTFFRIPLNVIVVVALYEDMTVKNVFLLCAILMTIAAACQHCLIQLCKHEESDIESKMLDIADEMPAIG